MADNIQTVEDYIESKIHNRDGPGSLLAEYHNKALKDVLSSVGKYTGSPYLARLSSDSGSIPTGVLVFNGNALNTVSDFVISLSKKTLDLNNIYIIVSSLESGDLMHFKDYKGRSFYFEIKSIAEGVDSNNLEIINLTVSGDSSNATYTYQADEILTCIIEFIIKRVSVKRESITVAGVEYTYAQRTETGTSLVPVQYDEAIGGVTDELDEDSNAIKVYRSLVYNTGTPSLLASWWLKTRKELI